MIEYLSGKSRLVFVIFLLLLFPALVINLGVHPLLNDEAIRSVMAMEMIFSDD
jgi:hypothetical protein